MDTQHPADPPTKRFRIALTFAGERREAVVTIADILAKRFGKAQILYDKFHQAEFARADLAFHLPDLYEAHADLIVAVLCPDYDRKNWCGLEWNAIYGLLMRRKVAEVMLCRFERVEGRGLRGLAGYLDLDEMTPEEAATEILERLAINEGRPPDFYKPAEPRDGKALHTAIPNNLPRLQPFFGREEELKAVAEALDPENRTWGALIDGPGGMGKTSLAVRSAYGCTPDQFDRILFVSVKDREMEDDGVRQTESILILPAFLEMLNELARELGRADLLRSPEDERPRLLLEALRTERALLVLDNLESLTRDDRDRLLTFVRRLPQGCKAILTSRRRIGSGSEALILQKLGQDAALEILADLARRNPLLAKTKKKQRIAIYKRTAGNPLLLRWVAGQLGRGSCRTLDDALAFLRRCPPDNDPLEFIFGDLVQEFTATETQVLGALTYFSLPVGLDHIRALIDPLSLREQFGFGSEYTFEDEDNVEGPQPRIARAGLQEALNNLANRSLVVPDPEERVYTLVPMVADFLRRRKPEVVAETDDRLEKRAYALAVENGYEKHDRFPVLDAAWPMISAALPRILAGPNGRLQTVCNAFQPFLDFTGRWDERLALAREAEARAVAAEDFQNAGWRVYDAGYVHYLRGQSADVLACADRAEAHWCAARAGPREQAVALHLRALGHQLAKDYSSAIAALREGLELWRALDPESMGVALGLNDLGGIKCLSGDLDGSEPDIREALRIARAIGYREGVAIFTGNLAALALDRGDWPGAEALAREALDLAEKVGRRELIADDCRRLAQALARQGRTAEALPHARRAVEIHTALRSPQLESARETLAECKG